jgi:hypothetical protein
MTEQTYEDFIASRVEALEANIAKIELDVKVLETCYLKITEILLEHRQKINELEKIPLVLVEGLEALINSVECSEATEDASDDAR